MDRPVYCFIDDSPFELELFKDVIEIRFPGILFIYASTYAECHSQLDKQKLYPSLFILDLYGREGQLTNVNIPQKEMLEAQIANIPSLDTVYKGLDKYEGDNNLQANEFLKRLFAILNEWRNLFSDQCANLDQGSQYGINNLLHVRKYYPTVTAVMYTRKGLFADAVKLSRHNSDGIFIKPSGTTDEKIYAETRNQVNSLMDGWNECIRNRYCLFLQKLTEPDQNVRELAEFLSLDKNHSSTDKDAKQRLITLLKSLQTTLSTNADISTPEVDALIQWTLFYYVQY
jgi:hypothetical protein